MVPKTPKHKTVFGEIQAKTKVVVAIDFGTTYSGVSYVYTDTPDIINCGAPGGAKGDEVKVPTALLQTPEGWVFGRPAIDEYHRRLEEVECIDSRLKTEKKLNDDGVRLYRHFKLALRQASKAQKADTITFPSTAGHHHNALDLVQQSLKILGDYALGRIETGYGAALGLGKSDITWVLTVPAIWDDVEKILMRRAAHKAGLIPNEASDKLLLALEPEGASMAVHMDGGSLKLFKQDSSFVMVDCGGGTIDVTAHKVESENPLALTAIIRPTGGLWGGTFVDKQFQLFLKDLFGAKDYERFQRVCPSEVEEVMENFRVIKEAFRPGNDSRDNRIDCTGLIGDYRPDDSDAVNLMTLVQAYNKKEGVIPFDLNSNAVKKQIERYSKLSFTSEQMLRFFEPTLDMICKCVQEVLSETKIDTIVIVGGYGASPVLADRVRTTFSEAKVIVPDQAVKPQAAIVHGASCFGLYSSIIESRISDCTYGVNTNQEWSADGPFPETAKTWDETLKSYRVKNVFSIIASKDDKVSTGKPFVRTGYSPLHKGQKTVAFGIFCSTKQKPLLTTEEDCKKLGSITVDVKGDDDSFDVEFLFETELRVKVTRSDGETEFVAVEL